MLPGEVWAYVRSYVYVAIQDTDEVQMEGHQDQGGQSSTVPEESSTVRRMKAGT